MTPARHCSTCSIDWPDRLHRCLRCEGETIYLADGEPVSDEEVNRLVAFAKFERLYESRGGQEVTDPEHIDALARVDTAIAEVKMLEAIPVAGEPLPVEPFPPEHFGKDAHLLKGEDTA
jgi:hypothetical protein